MSSRKVLAVDVETTGLDPAKHEIIQLAAIYVQDGVEVASINLHFRPDSLQTIDPEAIAVHGQTVDTLMSYPPRKESHDVFINWLSQHIDRYDPLDKAYPLAYCGAFDMSFLQAHFNAQGDKYLGSWINRRLLDPAALLSLLRYQGALVLPDHKLATVCKALNIPLVAHDALSDIRATLTVFNRLLSLIGF